MVQNTSKTLGFQKIMVYKTPPGGGEVNHIWLVAYKVLCLYQMLSFYEMRPFTRTLRKTDPLVSFPKCPGKRLDFINK